MVAQLAAFHKRSFCMAVLLGLVLTAAAGVSFVAPGASHADATRCANTHEVIGELEALGLLPHLSDAVLRDVVHTHRRTGMSLAEMLRDPAWCARLGLASKEFKATWYMANPFELLVPELQEAIRSREEPFRSSADLWAWCEEIAAPNSWRRALRVAMIETTAHNLWRASRGWRPFTRSGLRLEPLVIDHGLGRSGRFEVRGAAHIATDPAVIPTMSEVLILVRIDGKDRVLRVTAADTGAAVKGHHIDLPVHVGPHADMLPGTLLPLELRNPTIQVLLPASLS